MGGRALLIGDWRLYVEEVKAQPTTDMPSLTMNDLVSQQVAEIKQQRSGRRHVIPTTKNDLCRDLCLLIRQTAWSMDNIKDIYAAAVGVTRSKSCVVCKRLTSIFEGELVYPQGDLSKAKQFVCKGCASRL